MHKGLIALLLATGIGLAASPVFCRSIFDDGVDHYKAGRYKQAARCLENVLLSEPCNQIARYYLACTFVKAGDHPRAAEQYRLAYLLDPKTATAGYCKQAMAGYKMSMPTLQSLVKTQTAAVPETTPSEIASVRDTIRRQAGHAKDKQRLNSQDKENHLKQNVANKLKTIDDQMQYDLARLHDPLIVDSLGPRANPLLYLPEVMKEKEDAIRKSAKDAKDRILLEAQERSDSVNGAQKAQDSVLDEVADNLQSQLTAPQSRHGVKLQARGTSLYVRNYESSSGKGNSPEVRPAVVRIVDAVSPPPAPVADKANFALQ